MFGREKQKILPGSGSIYEIPVPHVERTLSFDETLAVLADPTHPRHAELKATAVKFAAEPIDTGLYGIQDHSVYLFTGARLEKWK